MNKTLALIVLIVLLATAAHANGPSGSGIVVRPAAAVQEDEVRVRDVARPVGKQARKAWVLVKDKVLMQAPRNAGDQERIPRDRLARIIAARLGRLSEGFVVPGGLVLQRGGEVLSEREIRMDVVEFLTARLAGIEGEPEMRDFHLPEHVFLEREGNRLEISLADALEAGRLSLRFEEIGPGGPTGRKYSGSVFLDLWISVPCAARPLNRGDRLAPELVRHRRRNAAYLRGEPWDGKALSLRLVRPVGEGQVIYGGDLEYIPMITKGEEVRLVFQGDYVRLEVPAEALSDGRQGENIPVRNLDSRREVMARVKDKDTVTVN
jgi:flagella basal body P-ring formation protein FlgA